MINVLEFSSLFLNNFVQYLVMLIEKQKEETERNSNAVKSRSFRRMYFKRRHIVCQSLKCVRCLYLVCVQSTWQSCLCVFSAWGQGNLFFFGFEMLQDFYLITAAWKAVPFFSSPSYLQSVNSLFPHLHSTYYLNFKFYVYLKHTLGLPVVAGSNH